MIRVGVTGGIGSGKSLVCEVFSKLGIPVYSADEEAHFVTNADPLIRLELIDIFGPSIYNGDSLNRLILAELIFKDKDLLQRVNQIIHPRVAEHFDNWCRNFSSYPYVIQESAIIFESGAFRSFHRIVAVTAPEELRLQRVMTRKNMTHEKFQSILRNQLCEEDLKDRSDFLIINDDIAPLLPQILNLHNLLISINLE